MKRITKIAVKIARGVKMCWDWLIWSSKDPEKVSTTVKASLVLFVNYLSVLAGLGLGNYIPSQSELMTLVNAIVLTIQLGLGFIASVAGVYGLFRKSALTMAGKNPVVNGQ